MKTVISWLGAALVAVLLVFFSFMADAHAALTLSGKIQYTRSWSGSQAGSLLPAAEMTGVKPVQKVYVAINCIAPLVCSGGNLKETFTNATGDWTVNYATGTITGPATGTFKVTITYQAQNLETLGTTGYRLVGSVSNGNGGWDPTTVKLKSTFNTATVATSGTVNTGTKLFSGSGADNRQANGFDVLRHQVERWRTLGMASVDGILSGAHFERAVAKITGFTDTDPNQSCGIADGTAPCFNFDTLPVDNTTGFHESGHALLDGLMKDFNGQGPWVYTGFTQQCLPPSTAGGGSGVTNSTGTAQVSESWANFTALLAFYNVATMPANLNIQFLTGIFPGSFDETDGVLNNCQSCEFAPSLTTPPNMSGPPCGNGSITRSESRSLKILVDLVDTVQGGTNCLTEDVAVGVHEVLKAIMMAPVGTCQGCLAELLQPFYYGNSFIPEDASSMLDILRNIDLMKGFADSRTQRIWRNNCWLPGDTDFDYAP